MMKITAVILAGALLLFSTWWIQGSDERALVSCRQLLQEGKPEQSLAVAQTIVAENPEGLPGIECLVRAHLAVGQEREAEAILLKLSGSAARDSETLTRLKADVMAAKAEARRRSEEIAEKCEGLRHAIGRGEGAEAEADIRKIVSENPRNRDAHSLLALFHLYATEDYAAAILAMEQAVRLADGEQREQDEAELENIRNMARVAEKLRGLVEEGKFSDACEVFREFRGEGTYSFEIVVLGAAALDGVGDTKEAYDELRTLSKMPVYSHGDKAERLMGLIEHLEAKLARAEIGKSISQKLEQAELAESEGRTDDASMLLLAAAREGRRADLALRVVDINTRLAGESQDDSTHLHMLRAAAALADARNMEPDPTTKSIISRTAEGQVVPVKAAIAHFRAEITREMAAIRPNYQENERLRLARDAIRAEGLRARPRDVGMIESLVLSSIALRQPQKFWHDLEAVAAAGQSEVAATILANPDNRDALGPLIVAEGMEKFPSKLSAVLRRDFALVHPSCATCNGSGQGPRAVVRCPGPEESYTEVFYLSPGNGWPVTIARGPCDNGAKRGSISINRDIGLLESRTVRETHSYSFRCTRCDGKGDSYVPTRCTICDGRGWNPSLVRAK